MEAKGKSLASFFDDGVTPAKKEEKVKEKGCCLPALLLKARTDAHISHLLQKDKTLARHEAFGTFYEEILGKADAFIESYMGIFPLTEIEVEASCCIDEPIVYFTDLYNQIQVEKAKLTEGYLQNQCDEISQLIAQTLYRFKNITT
jgi:hypothetical protein